MLAISLTLALFHKITQKSVSRSIKDILRKLTPLLEHSSLTLRNLLMQAEVFRKEMVAALSIATGVPAYKKRLWHFTIKEDLFLFIDELS